MTLLLPEESLVSPETFRHAVPRPCDFEQAYPHSYPSPAIPGMTPHTWHLARAQERGYAAYHRIEGPTPFESRLALECQKCHIWIGPGHYEDELWLLPIAHASEKKHWPDLLCKWICGGCARHRSLELPAFLRIISPSDWPAFAEVSEVFYKLRLAMMQKLYRFFLTFLQMVFSLPVRSVFLRSTALALFDCLLQRTETRLEQAWREERERVWQSAQTPANPPGPAQKAAALVAHVPAHVAEIMRVAQGWQPQPVASLTLP